MSANEPNDATPFLPERRSLTALREAAAGCRGCHLWRHASQTVFGEGLARARVVFVGEQPGDREDREGKPFVGPAGRELDRGLEAAGIDRGEVYVTNVVKHFAFEERGRRRLHRTPKRFEVEACKPWLAEELRVVAPEAVGVLRAPPGQAPRVVERVVAVAALHRVDAVAAVDHVVAGAAQEEVLAGQAEQPVVALAA